MADDEAQHDISEDEQCESDGMHSSDGEVVPAKRSRVQAIPGRQGALPTDILGTMIKMRIEKEKAFLEASDGRSRNSSGALWTDISKELKAAFGDREDVKETALNPRQLTKRWSYIETQFKVSVLLYLLCILPDIGTPSDTLHRRRQVVLHESGLRRLRSTSGYMLPSWSISMSTDQMLYHLQHWIHLVGFQQPHCSLSMIMNLHHSPHLHLLILHALHPLLANPLHHHGE
jgi:hypothetical protein